MAKQRIKPKQETPVTPAPVAPVAPAPVNPLFKLPGWSAYIIIFVFCACCTSNTLWNKFAIDDTIVLTDNKFTKKGFNGLKDHFTHDMFEGFFGERGAKLVSGGRYRPLSMATLTVEYEIVRRLRHDPRKEINDKNVIMGGEHDPYLAPMLSHSINVLLFGLTTPLLYYVLLLLIPLKKNQSFLLSIPFIVAMLYAAHPLHTEAVANIKGRDEVMCMLFSLLSLLAAIKYIKTKNAIHLVWGVFIYFIALMSKGKCDYIFRGYSVVLFFLYECQIEGLWHYPGRLYFTGGVFLIPAQPIYAGWAKSGFARDFE